MERISTIQTASVITQPTGATERPTLVERIQPILDDLMMECFKHGFHQSEMTEAEFVDYSRKNCVPLKREIISILKQHSEWVPVSELKLTKDDYGKDFIAYECEYFKTTGRATYQDGGYWRFDCARGYCASANISHVIPIPKFQPPSEVQDD